MPRIHFNQIDGAATRSRARYLDLASRPVNQMASSSQLLLTTELIAELISPLDSFSLYYNRAGQDSSDASRSDSVRESD